MKIQPLAFAAIAAFTLLGATQASNAEVAAANRTERVKIASNFVHANGCHETTQRFTTQVPNVDRLDRSFRGPLDGIEVVVTSANNGHASRNYAWAANGTAISYDLYAKGKGNYVKSPFGGGGVCVGAAGGWLAIDVYAHVIKP